MVCLAAALRAFLFASLASTWSQNPPLCVFGWELEPALFHTLKSNFIVKPDYSAALKDNRTLQRAKGLVTRRKTQEKET